MLRMPVVDKPITILDISALPAEIVDVVVSVVCRLVFDHAVWSDREAVTPVLLVCEEAHRYVPEYDKLGFQPTKRALARIAKEGRKYGVSLCLVSQRPSELSISTLSQCSTIFAMRMANESDHEFVGNALPESARTFLASLAALRTREAIVMGEGVTVPMRVLFDPLAPEHRPHSDSSLFSKRWALTEVDYDTILSDTIGRWRANARQIRQRPNIRSTLRNVVDDRAKSTLDKIGDAPDQAPRPEIDE
jgi:DNA helicase HerA-like ATPase